MKYANFITYYSILGRTGHLSRDGRDGRKVYILSFTCRKILSWFFQNLNLIFLLPTIRELLKNVAKHIIIYKVHGELQRDGRDMPPDGKLKNAVKMGLFVLYWSIISNVAYHFFLDDTRVLFKVSVFIIALFLYQFISWI